MVIFFVVEDAIEFGMLCLQGASWVEQDVAFFEVNIENSAKFIFDIKPLMFLSV